MKKYSDKITKHRKDVSCHFFNHILQTYWLSPLWLLFPSSRYAMSSGWEKAEAVPHAPHPAHARHVMPAPLPMPAFGKPAPVLIVTKDPRIPFRFPYTDSEYGAASILMKDHKTKARPISAGPLSCSGGERKQPAIDLTFSRFEPAAPTLSLIGVQLG